MNQTQKILSSIDNIFISNHTYNQFHTTPKNTVKEKLFNTKKLDMFYVEYPNKLLWAMYYILKLNNENFETNPFKIEQEFKIKNIEMINKNPDLLKTIKIKHHDVVHDLMHSKKIEVFSLQTLCVYHDITCIYVENKKYFILGNDEPKHIIIHHDNKIGIYLDANPIKINYYKNNYFHAENIKKPIKAISSYSTADIHDICIKINIPVRTRDGKNINKKNLYEEILRNL